MGQNYDDSVKCPRCGRHESILEVAAEARDRRAFLCGECDVRFDVRLPWLYFTCEKCEETLEAKVEES